MTLQRTTKRERQSNIERIKEESEKNEMLLKENRKNPKEGILMMRSTCNIRKMCKKDRQTDERERERLREKAKKDINQAHTHPFRKMWGEMH